MDLSSSLRRKQATVTYARRNRGGSTTLASLASPAIAIARPNFGATSSGASSDDDAGPSDKQRTRTLATLVSLSPSPKPSPSPSPCSQTPRARASHQPSRPARAASPSPTSAVQPNLALKRSASSSPRKHSSASPTKRRALSRTPSRPAQDLASLFDAIQPTLPQPRNPFARSESQPIVQLHRDDSQPALDPSSAFADSPLPSPTLHPTHCRDARPPSPGALTSPSRRPRMADRMAPRAARETKSKVDDAADALLSARKRSLRRTETAPSLVFAVDSPALFAEDVHASETLKLRQDEAASARLSDAGSVRIDTASQGDTQSQEGASSALGARRLAGIKQTSATNAKRTYGLQRSFLADRAEQNLLEESASQPPSAAAARNVQDEIEAELNPNATSPAGAPTPSASLAVRLPDSPPAPPRESYAELLKKWGEGADNIEWDESQDPTLNLKSITSLRSQGELRRFNDDLEYLFSGLHASQSLSIRKSSAVEVVRLLCGKPDIASLDGAEQDSDGRIEDPLASAQSADFLRKLKASDLIAPLFDLFRSAEAGEGVDDVLDVALGVYVAKLLKTASSAEALTRERWSKLLATLCELLIRADRIERHQRKDGLALLRLHDLKQHKIASRSDRNTLDELRAIARISNLFVAGSNSWTLRNLVLAACCSLIVLPRRLLGETAIGDLLVDVRRTDDRSHPSLFAIVLNVLVSEGGKAQQRLNDFAKGLELVTAAAVEAIPDLETVDVCLRFLDKGMDILYLDLDQAVPASNEALDALQNLIGFAIQAAPFGAGVGARVSADEDESGSTGASPTRALQVLHSLFKILLDLSQVDANWSESLASSQSLQSSIMQAFLLSHQSAAHLRQSTAPTNEPNSAKGKARDVEQGGRDGSEKLDVALFDDVVHLSLALLTNLLIKQHDKARDTLESVQLEPLCWGRRSCCVDCGSEDRLPALRLLARLFFETRIAAASQDDSNAAYLSNSIATAIAQFAVGGAVRKQSCQLALDAELPKFKDNDVGGSVIKNDGFLTLLDAVEEFAVVHQAAMNAEHIRAAEMDAIPEAHSQREADEDEMERDSTIPVAMEAGQLIKDLALALRHMA